MEHTQSFSAKKDVFSAVSILGKLEGKYWDLATSAIEFAYHEQLTYTPEYYRKKEQERQEKRQAFEKALQRPGFILIAWGYCWPEHYTRSWFQAYWLPETGPRWVHHKSAVDKLEEYDKLDPAMASKITLACYHFSRKDILKSINERFIKDSKRTGLEFNVIAPHLLWDGPDRRAAYLQRTAARLEPARVLPFVTANTSCCCPN